MQHYLDTDGYSTSKGNSAEHQYEIILNKNKIKYRIATRSEQQDHWDFLIKNKKIEVKSAKSKNKYEEPTSKIILELHGKQSYNVGWLRGKSDFVAFLQEDGFIHFKRESLLEWISGELFNKNISVIEKRWGMDVNDYQLYYRPGNPEERFCFVPLKDIPLKFIKLKN